MRQIPGVRSRSLQLSGKGQRSARHGRAHRHGNEIAGVPEAGETVK